MGVSVWGRYVAGGAGRIPFVGAGGVLTDSNELKYDATANELSINPSSGTPAFALKDGGTNQSTWALDGSLNSIWTIAAGKLGIIGVGATNVLAYDANRTRSLRRFNFAQGADVPSNTTLTLGNDGNLFNITGTTTIDFITHTDWTAGSPIFLISKGAITFRHNIGSPPANTAAMKIAGAANLVTATGDMLVVWYDGTVMRLSRIGATGA